MNDFFVEQYYGSNLSRRPTSPVFLVTNKPLPVELNEDSIICLSEQNANIICELLNESNSFNPEHDSTSELKEVLDCLNKYSRRLNHDIVRTVVEEVYSTKRELKNNVE